MVEFHGGFNANEHEDEGFTTIPEGTYDVIVKASERKENSKKTGHILKVTFQIIEGEFKNRTVITNFNMWNQSEQAQKIARSEFANLCKAVDKPLIQDSSDIHKIPLQIKIGHRKYDGKVYEDVKAYHPAGAKRADTVPFSVPGEEEKEATPW